MPLGVAGLFQDNQVGFQQGGAPMSLWMAESLRRGVPIPTRDWRMRLRDWAEDVELVPDLGQRIGSRTWFRGLATCFGLCASALYLSPGFQPVPGAPGPTLSDAQYDEVRSQMITPLALGGDSGHRMGSTDAVQPLRETPERPQIELSAQVGSSDTLARALSRAGVSSADVAAVVGMAGADIAGGVKPGTRLNIVLGRRASRDQPRPLDKLAFRARLDLDMTFERLGGVLSVQRVPIRVDNTPLRIQGVVGDSIYRSARAAGAPPKAVQAFLRVIAKQVDLGSIAAGDRYDIVTEYRQAETGDVEVGSGEIDLVRPYEVHAEQTIGERTVAVISRGPKSDFAADSTASKASVIGTPASARRHDAQNSLRFRSVSCRPSQSANRSASSRPTGSHEAGRARGAGRGSRKSRNAFASTVLAAPAPTSATR